MKPIDLNELKGLAISVASAEEGSPVWDRATDALNAKFSPASLVNLIEQLEAAQRDAQQLEADNISLDASYGKILQRAEAAEAELKHRDAQEPVAWRLINAPEAAVSVTDNAKMAAVWKRNGRIIEPLVTHAGDYSDSLPANNIEKLRLIAWGERLLSKWSPSSYDYNLISIAVSVLKTNSKFYAAAPAAVLEALDAAGVKWVEGEQMRKPLKTRATDLTPCPFCSGPPVTFLREIINDAPFYLSDERLSSDESDGLYLGVRVFCHECGAQAEEIEGVVYFEADVGDLISKARNAWLKRDTRHFDLFESSKSARETDHLDRYFSAEELCSK